LRVFVGGRAGQTAVRTMLLTAEGARRTGIDVVVGLINDRELPGIDTPLSGFETLAALPGAGARRPPRIDLKAVRRRRPAVLLVDTSVPALSVNGRTRLIQDFDAWADIEAVLALGVSVWATLDAIGFSANGLLSL
jgi:K+-sensing histidine kinase KdpD